MMSRVSLNLSPLSVQQPKLSSSLPPIHSHKFLDEKPLSSSYYQESDIFEDIPITLLLPDGVTFKLIVKTGETVQEIKRKLDTLHGIPYSDATLFYNGKCMIDPLSLNDFPGLVCKTNICLDVKISSWKPKEPIQQQQLPQTGSQHISNSAGASKNEPRKNDFMDIGAPEMMLNVASTGSLNSISFVEYVDAPLHTGNNNNTSNINNINPSHHQPDLYGNIPNSTTSSSPPSSPPQLPNAFSDSPNLNKINRRKPESETTTKTGSTTIDVKDDDDDDPQCKDIQKLGGSSSKRWKLCFLF